VNQQVVQELQRWEQQRWRESWEQEQTELKLRQELEYARAQLQSYPLGSERPRAEQAVPQQPINRTIADLRGPGDAQTQSFRGDENFEAQNRRMQLLYFMLFASIGLNFYLGWLARSFYSRYEDLADELRETFTAST
jgi:hypothetical protein